MKYYIYSLYIFHTDTIYTKDMFVFFSYNDILFKCFNTSGLMYDATRTMIISNFEFMVIISPNTFNIFLNLCFYMLRKIS